MTTLSLFFIFQLVLASIFVLLVPYFAFSLLLTILKKLYWKKKALFQVSGFIKKGLLLLFALCFISVFTTLMCYFEKDAHKTISSFRTLLGDCNVLGFTYTLDNDVFESYVARDPNTVEKVCKILIDSKYKLSRPYSPFAMIGNKVDVNAIRDGADGLSFMIFSNGIVVLLNEDNPFFHYKYCDKSFFDNIYVTLREGECFYKNNSRSKD